jgi:hypothetical protein
MRNGIRQTCGSSIEYSICAETTMPAQRDSGVCMQGAAAPVNALIPAAAGPQGASAKAAPAESTAQQSLLKRFLDNLMRALAPWPI